jgi:ADP-L-glycero-D-manno-heptose 6-epimerase
MIVITGGAGFIGSNLAAALEDRRERDIVICDRLGSDDKWRNLAKREIAHLVLPERLLDFLDDHAHDIHVIFHLGAISSTLETDADLIVANNFTLSHELWSWCAARGARFFYASSASTYGSGDAGFDDVSSSAALARLRPLNAYGWSKHLFDRRVARLVERGGLKPAQWVGCKFFNVYGPNEYHKGALRSVAHQIYPLAKAGKPAQLFRSYRDGIADGGQQRDFVYVRDCVDMLLWLYDNPEVSGLFNMGSGKARSFADLAAAVYRAVGREPLIDYVEMPPALRERYQYFTEASMAKLHGVGYTQPTTSLEDGVAHYIQTYLGTDDPYH